MRDLSPRPPFLRGKGEKGKGDDGCRMKDLSPQLERVEQTFLSAHTHQTHTLQSCLWPGTTTRDALSPIRKPAPPFPRPQTGGGGKPGVDGRRWSIFPNCTMNKMGYIYFVTNGVVFIGGFCGIKGERMDVEKRNG